MKVTRKQSLALLSSLGALSLAALGLVFQAPHLTAIEELNACGATVLSYDFESRSPLLPARWAPPLEEYSVFWFPGRGPKPPAFLAPGAEDARTVRDQDLALLPVLGRLRILDLNGQPVGDEGLIHLKGLASLKYLKLRETRVSDVGLATLVDISGLKHLDLVGSAVTPAGVAALRAKRPDLEIEYEEAR